MNTNGPSVFQNELDIKMLREKLDIMKENERELRAAFNELVSLVQDMRKQILALSKERV